MPVTMLKIADIDHLFRLFRASNQADWGDEFNSRWVFRGHKSTKWGLLPRIWRADELKNFSDALAKIDGMLTPHIRKWAGQENNKFGAGFRHQEASLRILLRVVWLQNLLIRAFSAIGQDTALIEGVVQNWGYEYLHQWNVREALEPIHNANGDIVTIAQHHGIPTYYLDWTRDPLNAIWFSIAGNTEPEACIWALDLGKLWPNGPLVDYNISVMRPDPTRNPYLHAQSGVLTHVGLYEKYFEQHGEFPAVEEIADAFFPPDTLRKYVFDTDSVSRMEITRRLWRERRSLPHLMPTLDNAANFATQVVKLGLFEKKM